MDHIRHRKIISPAFNFGQIRDYVPVFNYHAAKVSVKLTLVLTPSATPGIQFSWQPNGKNASRSPQMGNQFLTYASGTPKRPWTLWALVRAFFVPDTCSHLSTCTTHSRLRLSFRLT